MSDKENVKDKKTKKKFDYIPIEIELNSQEDGMKYFNDIDIGYCYDNLIGPFYLHKEYNAFNDIFKDKTTSLNSQLKALIEYDKYIICSSMEVSCDQFEKLYSAWTRGIGSRIMNISKEQLTNYLIYCNSNVLRLLLYLAKLNSIPLANYSKKYNNSDNISKNQSIQEQIELDLPRTFPEMSVFKDIKFKTNFRSVLYAITERDKKISYVQSMNFIAGQALIISGNQSEMALIIFTKIFCLKSKLFNVTFRECFTKEFSLLFQYITHFRELMRLYEKDIYDKVIKININDHLWVSKWLLTLFLTTFDDDVVLKFWDVLIAKGIDYILVISLTIVSFLKDKLVACERLDQFMKVICDEIKLDKERRQQLLTLLLSNVENNVYKMQYDI